MLERCIGEVLKQSDEKLASIQELSKHDSKDTLPSAKNLVESPALKKEVSVQIEVQTAQEKKQSPQKIISKKSIGIQSSQELITSSLAQHKNKEDQIQSTVATTMIQQNQTDTRNLVIETNQGENDGQNNIESHRHPPSAAHSSLQVAALQYRVQNHRPSDSTSAQQFANLIQNKQSKKEILDLEETLAKIPDPHSTQKPIQEVKEIDSFESITERFDTSLHESTFQKDIKAIIPQPPKTTKTFEFKYSSGVKAAFMEKFDHHSTVNKPSENNEGVNSQYKNSEIPIVKSLLQDLHSPKIPSQFKQNQEDPSKEQNEDRNPEQRTTTSKDDTLDLSTPILSTIMPYSKGRQPVEQSRNPDSARNPQNLLNTAPVSSYGDSLGQAQNKSAPRQLTILIPPTPSSQPHSLVIGSQPQSVIVLKGQDGQIINNVVLNDNQVKKQNSNCGKSFLSINRGQTKTDMKGGFGKMVTLSPTAAPPRLAPPADQIIAMTPQANLPPQEKAFKKGRNARGKNLFTQNILFKISKNDKIKDNITSSGGEPLDQAEEDPQKNEIEELKEISEQQPKPPKGKTRYIDFLLKTKSQENTNREGANITTKKEVPLKPEIKILSDLPTGKPNKKKLLPKSASEFLNTQQAQQNKVNGVRGLNYQQKIENIKTKRRESSASPNQIPDLGTPEKRVEVTSKSPKRESVVASAKKEVHEPLRRESQKQQVSPYFNNKMTPEVKNSRKSLANQKDTDKKTLGKKEPIAKESISSMQSSQYSTKLPGAVIQFLEPKTDKDYTEMDQEATPQMYGNTSETKRISTNQLAKLIDFKNLRFEGDEDENYEELKTQMTRNRPIPKSRLSTNSLGLRARQSSKNLLLPQARESNISLTSFKKSLFNNPTRKVSLFAPNVGSAGVQMHGKFF